VSNLELLVFGMFLGVVGLALLGIGIDAALERRRQKRMGYDKKGGFW
jgi:hypothetical protein